MNFIRRITALNPSQSVALAGTFENMIWTIDVDEALAMRAGFSGQPSTLPIEVVVVQLSDDEGSVSQATTVTAYRTGPGTWYAISPPPVIEADSAKVYSANATISAPIYKGQTTTEVLATPQTMQGASCPMSFARAAS